MCRSQLVMTGTANSLRRDQIVAVRKRPDGHPEIGSLADEWDALADRLSAPPFLRPGWIHAWWDAFGSGELEVLSVRRNGVPAGILPLSVRGAVLEAPANWHTPSFGPLAVDADAAAELIDLALQQRKRRVSLGFLDVGDPTTAQVRSAFADARQRVYTEPRLRSPFLDLDGDWDAYLASRPRSLRKEIGRCERRLRELGDLEMTLTSDSTNLDRDLDEAFAVEGSGWKRQRGTAIDSHPSTRDFYRRVATWAADRGFLRLFTLRLAGVAVACDICLEDGGVRYMLKGGYDERFARFAPGLVLLRMGLEDAFANGLSRIELGGADDSYKLRWTSAVRERLTLHAFPPTVPGFAGWIATARLKPAAKRLLRR
jgi:CelD/BcsL family acetyltransferase involved in cellulose biosynthesis